MLNTIELSAKRQEADTLSAAAVQIENEIALRSVQFAQWKATQEANAATYREKARAIYGSIINEATNAAVDTSARVMQLQQQITRLNEEKQQLTLASKNGSADFATAGSLPAGGSK